MFCETAGEVAAIRTRFGCEVVDIECAALASVGAYREVPFTQVLYPQDSLATAIDGETWRHGRGTGTGPARRGLALRVGCRAAVPLK